MSRPIDPSIRTRIIEEAEHLMHLRGFHMTCLDDIAAACSMTKANLLHHFKSKEALGLAVLDFKIQAYRCGCLESLSRREGSVQAIRKMFADAACFHRNNGCKAGCFIGNIALEMSDINERFRTKAQDFFKEWTLCLEACLKHDLAAGVFEPSLDPLKTAESILALYQGAVMLARTTRDPAVFDRVGQEACRFLETRFALNRPKEVAHHGTEDALRLLKPSTAA